MHVNSRQLHFDGAAEIDIERALHPRRQPCLHAHFRRAQVPRFFRAPDHLLGGQIVAFFRTMAAAESAKAAPLHTHIREVDISIHHVSDAVAHPAPPQFVRRRHGGSQFRTSRAEQPLAFLHGDLTAAPGGLENTGKLRRATGDRTIDVYHRSSSCRTRPAESASACTRARMPSGRKPFCFLTYSG